MGKPFVILGAGISGLSLGWYLKKKFPGASLLFIEKCDRPGGWIQTQIRDGFLFELGPRGIRPKGKGVTTLELVEELELQDQVIVPNHDARRRYLYHNRRLEPIPAGIWECMKSPLLKGVLTPIIRDLLQGRSRSEDESIYSFFSRRIGIPFTELFIDPLISGIFAGNPEQLSMKACFPDIWNMEKENRSLIKSMLLKKKEEKFQSEFIRDISSRSLYSFKNGMAALPNALFKKMDAEYIFGAERIQLAKDRRSLIVDEGKQIDAEHIFSTIPGYEVEQLLERPDFFELEQASLAVINVGYADQVLPYSGYGYLVPRKERQDILGMVWDSCIFPQQNINLRQTRVTVMVGGARMEGFGNYSLDEFKRMAKKALSSHLGIQAEPDVCEGYVAKKAIAQYAVGHVEKIRESVGELKKEFPFITFLGSSFYGVSVNDCIHNARQAAAYA